MPTIRLLSCPFCGEDEAQVIKQQERDYSDSPEDSLLLWVARCSNCGACGPSSNSTQLSPAANEAQAAAAWNSRPAKAS